MDYSKLSDFEVNKMVGKATKQATTIEPCFEVVIRNANGQEFNPCNNPADAWSIIAKNNISIINDKNCYPRATNDSYAFIHEQFDDCIHALDRNPLRAAMLVYLMLQDK